MSRRRFLRASAVAAAAAGVAPMTLGATPWPNRAAPALLIPRSGTWLDPDLPALARRAVEAAMGAGASYADVRLTLMRHEGHFVGEPPGQSELHGVGVRVLANGQWGFLSSATWTPDEMVRLAHGAVAMAKAHATIRRRSPVVLSPIPTATGAWTAPIKYDPFHVSFGEKQDFLATATGAMRAHRGVKRIGAGMSFDRMEKVFASSEGSAWTQTTFSTAGTFNLELLPRRSAGLPEGGAEADFMTPANRGWEHILESGLIEAIPQLIEEAEASRYLKEAELGRYEMVVSAQAMSPLVCATLGEATELDRALGYEANAGGTSYLDRPLEMLGTQLMGAPILNVTANRNVEGGLGTVQWDDDSVVPETFPIVTDGILVDYQTTREQVAWLAPYYEKRGIPARSHGCAGSESALFIPLQHAPNVQLMPGPDDVTFDDLVADTKDGLALMRMRQSPVLVDHQKLNGFGVGVFREIKKGKLGPVLMNAGMVFRTPELWKGLMALGGPRTTRWFGVRHEKGQPEQETESSVGTVPAKFRNVAMVNLMRRQ